MVTECRIYAEGGGNERSTKARLRQGLSTFLGGIINIARARGVRWQIIACGSRTQAFNDFMFALQDHPEAFNVLLVDSEGPVSDQPWEHLRERDGWSAPGVDSECCHLMVQMMETWFVADLEALRQYYGQEFRENAIPRNPNVEEIEKGRLAAAMREATRYTQKGEYRKIKHGSELLALIDSDRVRQAAPHCEHLFATLIRKMN